MRRPLVVTEDPELLDEILTIAAAAGMEVTAAVDPREAAAHWDTAPLVLLDARLADRLPGAGLAGRPGLVLVRPDSTDTGTSRRSPQLRHDRIIPLPAGSEVLLASLAECHEGSPQGRLVGVIAGSGGAGASVVAAALALTAAAPAGNGWLVDLDPAGGGLDLLLGLEGEPGLRWPGLHGTSGRLDCAALRDALPVLRSVAILSCDRTQRGGPEALAVEATLAAIRRGGGTAIVDLPRQPSAARAVALAAIDQLLVVVAAEVRSVAAAHRLLDELPEASAPVSAVVQVGPPGLLAADQIAAALGVPLGGQFVRESTVREALVQGRPPALRRGSLARMCEALAADLTSQPAPAAAMA